MNKKAALNKMTETAAQLNAVELKEQIVNVYRNDDEHFDYVLIALLEALEAKIPSAEYVAFCDSLGETP